MIKHYKILTCAISILLIITTLAGCSGNTNLAIGNITNKTTGKAADINLRHYLFNAYYAHLNLEYNISKYNSENGTTDTLQDQLAAATTEDNTKNYNQIYTDQLRGETEETAILLDMFDTLGLEMTPDRLTDAESYAASIKNSLGENVYTNFRKAMQLTETDMKSLLMELYKTGVVKQQYFGEGAEFAVTEDQIKKSFNEDYARVKHILIKNTDSTTGNKLSDDDLNKAKAKVQDLLKQAQSGADFDKLARYNSQDRGGPDKADDTSEKKETYELSDKYVAENYGYTIPRNSGMVAEFENAAFDMKVGEIKVVETSFGWHIMKKYDQNEVAEIYNQLASTIKSNLDQKKYAEQMAIWKQNYDLSFNDSLLNKYSLMNLKNIMA